jgi:hypothetical protein
VDTRGADRTALCVFSPSRYGPFEEPATAMPPGSAGGLLLLPIVLANSGNRYEPLRDRCHVRPPVSLMPDELVSAAPPCDLSEVAGAQ